MFETPLTGDIDLLLPSMEQTLGHEGHYSSDSEITFEIPRPNDNPYEAKVNRTRHLVSYYYWYTSLANHCIGRPHVTKRVFIFPEQLQKFNWESRHSQSNGRQWQWQRNRNYNCVYTVCPYPTRSLHLPENTRLKGPKMPCQNLENI